MTESAAPNVHDPESAYAFARVHACEDAACAYKHAADSYARAAESSNVHAADSYAAAADSYARAGGAFASAARAVRAPRDAQAARYYEIEHAAGEAAEADGARREAEAACYAAGGNAAEAEAAGELHAARREFDRQRAANAPAIPDGADPMESAQAAAERAIADGANPAYAAANVLYEYGAGAVEIPIAYAGDARFETWDSLYALAESIADSAYANAPLTAEGARLLRETPLPRDGAERPRAIRELQREAARVSAAERRGAGAAPQAC